MKGRLCAEALGRHWFRRRGALTPFQSFIRFLFLNHSLNFSLLCRQGGSRCFARLMRGPDKAVATTRNCLDIVLTVRAFTESFSEQVDVLCEIAFFDHTVGPDELYQLFLLQHLSTVLNQRNQRVYGLGRQRQRLAIAQEQAIRYVYAEGS